MRRAAVIDIGSNSIKALVATRDAAGGLQALVQKTEDARISRGISQAEPRLTEEGMQRGLDAVRVLLEVIRPYEPDSLTLVATSAVRDAHNGAEFADRIATLAGQPLRVLSGAEEAELISRGMRCDPALADARDFYVFDLGGGSLECLSFQDGTLRQSTSLPLGCVRLTERFVADPARPLLPAEDLAIRTHVRATLAAGFSFDLGVQPAVFAGGSMTSVRLMLAAAAGVELAEVSAQVSVATLTATFRHLAALPLAEREIVPGLPARRADVMPTALATILTLAEGAGFEDFQHSFYNLRWGLAARALQLV